MITIGAVSKKFDVPAKTSSNAGGRFRVISRLCSVDQYDGLRFHKVPFVLVDRKPQTCALERLQCVRATMNENIVDLCFSDEEDDRKPAAIPTSPPANQELGNEVEIVDAPGTVMDTEPVAHAVTAQADLAVVGTCNQVLLPHMRQHCTNFPFRLDMKKHCDFCYCYICDVPVKDCRDWLSHCFATDEGDKGEHYKRLRVNERQRKSTATTAASTQRTSQHQPTLNAPSHISPELLKTGTGRSLFEDPLCQHCKSPAPCSQFGSRVSLSVWCSKCGRVWSDVRNRPKQGVKYTPKDREFHLGTKKIPFRLRPHDPRKLTSFKKDWAENEGKPGWIYDEKAIGEEMFKMRMGTRPSLENLLTLIPVLPDDKLPTDGSIATISQSHHGYSAYDDRSFDSYEYGGSDSDSYLDDYICLYRRKSSSASKPRLYNIVELQSMILEDEHDRELLVQMYQTAPTFGYQNSLYQRWLNGDIVADYDRETMTGVSCFKCFSLTSNRGCLYQQTLTIKAYLPLTRSTNVHRDVALADRAAFLGTWYRILPFTLDEVKINLEVAHEYEWPKNPDLHQGGILTKKECVDAKNAIATEFKASLKAHQKTQVEQRRESYTLESSSGKPYVGGVCTNATDLKGSLLRFFRELAPELLLLKNGYIDLWPQHNLEYWIAKGAGVCQDPHRAMRFAETHRKGSDKALQPLYRSKLRPFLKGKDESIATIMSYQAAELYSSHSSHAGLLKHLESKGHASAPFVEGLSIELLPFQKQALQWAVERELATDGVQSFVWTKLPSVGSPGKDIYYNPILGNFMDSKPRLVRGGILAQNMGMGKTVICLALILSNPAPVLPHSGASPADISQNPDEAAAHWDPHLKYDDNDEEDENVEENTYLSVPADVKPAPKPALKITNEKRGKILSRGTLVIVSRRRVYFEC